MICRLALGVLVLGACKAEIADGVTDGGSPPVDGNPVQGSDAGVDGDVPLGPWGAPQKIPGGDSSAGEDDVALTSSRLELYFKRSDADSANLYMMTRATLTSPWSAPAALTVLNSNVDEESPRLTTDDLTMYFGRDGDVYKSTRTAVGQPWGAAVPVTTLNTGAYEKWAVVCPSGYVLVSRSVSNRGQDLFEGDIATGANTPVGQLNSTENEQGTFLSSDCLRVYFQSDRTNGQFDIYMATRVTMTAAWSNASLLTDFNTPGNDEEDPWISPDQRTFAFASDADGNKDLYISTR